MIGCRAVSSDITPLKPVPLAGFGNRSGNFGSVHDPLDANLIVLEQGKQRIAILSVDLLYFGSALQKCATEAALRFLSITPENLLLGASHTHFAPSTDSDKPRLGAVDDDYLEATGDTIEALFKQAADLPSSNVRMEIKSIQMHHTVNRRRYGWHIDPEALRLVKGIYMAPNFAETVDDTAHVLRFVDENDTLQAVLWNYACHPTGFPDIHSVSADFPGAVRVHIRKHFSSVVPVVFLQGFAGDKRPIELGGRIRLLGRIRRLVGGPHFGKFDRDTHAQWSEALTKNILETFNVKDAWRTILPDLAVGRSTLELADIVDGRTGTTVSPSPMTVQCIRLGHEATIIALAAEPVSQYVGTITDAINIPKTNVIPVGCTDNVFGYLPTSDMARKGGYEVSGFFPAFNLSGQFNDNFESRVINTVKQAYDLASQTQPSNS